MKSVVLSTTEAEYMALSEVVKELKFIVQLLQTMNIQVELLNTVFVDNVGAIWLSINRTTVRELDLAMCASPSSNGSKMRSLWTNQKSPEEEP